MRPLLTLFMMILLMAIVGCGNDDPQLFAWQQQQLEHIQRQTEHNTAAAQALVEADAQARQQLVALERDLQIERAGVTRQRDAIESERKSLAEERQRAPLRAAALHGLGVSLLAVLPLVVCWLLLRNSPGDNEATDLENLLVSNLSGDESTLCSGLPAFHPINRPVTTALEIEQGTPPARGEALTDDR